MSKKTNKTFKVGDYIVYDNPHDYQNEGTVIDFGEDSYVQIFDIEGRKRIFFESEFKYLTVVW